MDTSVIRALIFDVDGTLVDSVDAHAAAWQEALGEFGYDVDFGRMRSQIGKGGDQILPELLGEDEAARNGEKISARRSEIFRAKYKGSIEPFSGVRALFERLRQDDIRLLLASSAKGPDLADYRRLAQIDDLVEDAASADDAERSKPHPDIFEAALDRLENVPRKAIFVVGDTPYDAEAATKAGVRCIGMLGGGFDEKDLRKAGCIAVFDDPEDMLARYDELTAAVHPG